MNVYPMQNILTKTTLEETYRNHQLVSYIENGKCIGEVFKNNISIVCCASDNATTTLQHTRSIVDQLIKEKVLERKNAIPTQKQIILGLSAIAKYFSITQKALFHYLMRHDNQAVPIEKLQKTSKCTTTTGVYFALADFSRMLCDELAYEPPMPLEGRDPFIAMVIEPETDYTNTNASITLKLQANLFSALKSITWP
ncbi:MAG: hypothetical protein ACJAS1_003528 [Oleiphilaceae bacterium]|jgi:hypothetical protein